MLNTTITPTKKLSKIVTGGLLAVSLFGSAGCAHTRKPPANSVDPYEGFNRQIFQFNETMDTAFIRPIAITYTKITPAPLRKGIRNVYSNVSEVPTIANDILQANITQTFADSWRLLFNSTLGIGGLFDVAQHLGLHKHHNDFGLTLAKWGVARSPYLILPFFGPSTARDTLGWAVDYNTLSIWPHIKSKTWRYSLYGGKLLSDRAALLPADRLIKQSFDPYVFMRDAYLQQRDAQVEHVRSGKPMEPSATPPVSKLTLDEETEASPKSTPHEQGEPQVAKAK